MKIVSCLLLLAVLLCGCSGAEPAWETVDDVLPSEPVSSWQEEAYTITVGVPAEAALLASSNGWNLYATETGDCEIQTGAFLASSLDSAVRQLSGYDADRLLIIETTRFDLPEYQFAWYTDREEGGYLCQADLVMDGMRCYAVVCSRAEAAGSAYDGAIRQVFSSFGLHYDEGV